MENIVIDSSKAYDVIDKGIEPVCYCSSGNTVTFITRDCYDNSVVDEAFPLGNKENPLENPVTGPLYISDAAKGDTLKIFIEKIELNKTGVMRTNTECGYFHERYKAREAIIFDVEDGFIRFSEELRLKAAPMVGVIGTAPEGKPIFTHTPDYHGGNLDCRLIREGSTLYLPVNVDGALLFLGDLHALMGDGEMFICGLEIAGEVTLRVEVLKNSDIPTPAVISDSRLAVIGSADTIFNAGKLASNALFDYINNNTKLGDVKTGMLMSLCSNLVVCQVINPLMTARVEIETELLERLGITLP